MYLSSSYEYSCQLNVRQFYLVARTSGFDASLKSYMKYLFLLYLIVFTTMSEEQVKVENLPPDTEETLRRLFKGHEGGWSRFGAGGYVLPASFAAHADALRRMPVRSDDVWVLTYPRSGTTLIQEMVWLLENNLDYETALRIPLLERYMFLEIFAFLPSDPPTSHTEPQETDTEPEYKTAETVPSPRFFKSHLPLSLLPPLLDSCRVVYVARDPRDVAVSYYHHNRLIKLFDFVGDFKAFWDLFVEDAVSHTPFFGHLKEAWAQREHPNMLFMFYEDIIKDKTAAIHRVSKFFGKEYSEEEIQKLSTHLGIDNFRTNESINPSAFYTTEMVNKDAEPFVRKGGAGGWRKYFDEEMREQAERWMQRHLNDTDLRFPST